MLNLGIRNFKLYVRDRAGVFFSFLGIVVIIGLYVLFLGNDMKNNLDGVNGGDILIDSWVMAGIIAVASVTTSLGACGIMVDDCAKKNRKDFMSAPLKRYQIVGGYVWSACLVGLVMSIITFVIAEVYLVMSGAAVLSALSALKVLGIIFLTVLSSSAMVLFITSFLRTSTSFNNVSIVMGTLIGFITGMYLPVGILSEKVQLLVKGFPISHASVLLRQVMMEDTMRVSFEGAPAEMLEAFQEKMGVVFVFGDTTCTTGIHIAVLSATAIVFFVLAIVNISRKEK